MSAARFVTHLRYLFVRADKGRQLDPIHVDVLSAVRDHYPEAAEAAIELSRLFTQPTHRDLAPTKSPTLHYTPADCSPTSGRANPSHTTIRSLSFTQLGRATMDIKGSRQLALGGIALVALLSTPFAPARADGSLADENTTPPLVTPSPAPKEERVHPFLRDEIIFRSSPTWTGLLFGSAEPVTAHALLRGPCPDEKMSITLVPGHQVIPTRFDAEGSSTTPVPGIARLDTPQVMTGPATASGAPAAEAPCPVVLTAQMSVAHATSGWLIEIETPTPQTTLSSDTAANYRVIKVMGTSAYALLGVTALAIAVLSLVAIPLIRSYRRNIASNQDGSQAPSPDDKSDLPVLAAVTTAATGAAAWSGWVPGLDFAGVAVVGILSFGLVEVGKVICWHSAGCRSWWRHFYWLGYFLSVSGMSVIALLPLFVLLHGATIGKCASWVWLGAAVVLLIGSLLFHPQKK
ncbi:MAG: hypothetical protein QM708_06820 [Propioniciclava sp.]|uniref:hypothetical protein n=1 Tax=Propioniciclava sp. TaxID=2038686 RepID=UPI0039E5D6BF